MITVAFTGHRPVKLFFGYDESAPACSRIKEQLEKLIVRLASDPGELRFITGMAMGTDIWAAEAVLRVKNLNPAASISLICAVPYEGHIREMADANWRSRYEAIISAAKSVQVLSLRYTQSCMEERDRWMVKRADKIIAVLNASHSLAKLMKITKLPPETLIRADSGTAATVLYALSCGKPVAAIDPEYEGEPVYLGGEWS